MQRFSLLWQEHARPAAIALISLIAALLGQAISPTPVEAGVITSHAVINEIVADPTTGSAWVEIYNPTGASVSLCGISDDDGNQTSGCGNMIGAFWTLVIDPDFLDDGGDTITLRGTTGDVDTVTYPALGPGQSYARTFDASTDWEVRSDSRVTRNASNGAVPDDSTAPVLTVTSPVSGTTYAGGFTVGYSASDPVAGVRRVAFYLRDGTSTGAYEWTGSDTNTADQEPFNSIEEFHSLTPGVYDLCVTSIDKLGNGAPSLASPLATCDTSSTAVVAVDDVTVSEYTPPGEPALALAAPADGSVTDDGTPTLSWTLTIDPSMTLLDTTLTLSTSADLSATPVTYAPSGTSFTPPEVFGTAADATWFWKVAVRYAATPTSPTETIESKVWSFTVDRSVDEEPPAEFTVVFDANGGAGTMSPQTASSPTALKANEYSRVGHRFVGWNSAADGGGTAYGPGATYPFAADATLFAQWDADPPPTSPPTLPPTTSPTGPPTLPPISPPVDPNLRLPQTGTSTLALPAVLLVVAGSLLCIATRRCTTSLRRGHISSTRR